MKTTFRKACELWDNVAGPADWQVFADEFDDAIGNLTGDELDVVGELINRLQLAKAVAKSQISPIDDHRVSTSPLDSADASGAI